MAERFEFSAPIERISVKGGSHYVLVPEDIAQYILGGAKRGRALVTLNGTTWHAGMNPIARGRHYVQVGRNYFEPHGYKKGDVITVQIERDGSTYGMQPCAEFLAVSAEDPEGTHLFQQLTPGTQRSILHRIANGRSPDARIERALKIFDQLHLGERDRQTLIKSIRADAMRGEPGLLSVD